VVVDDGQDAPRRSLDAHAEGLCHTLGDSAARTFDVELEAAAEEVGRQVP
jgi:hypothetical protein